MTMLGLPKNNRYRITVEKWTINIASLWKLTIAEVYCAEIFKKHFMTFFCEKLLAVVLQQSYNSTAKENFEKVNW